MTQSLQWSERELREAIGRERSWRGVARALGRSPTSAGAIRTIRRHAERLGIDTSHFTGQRRWSDQELREAVSSSSSWSEVANRLGITSGETVTSMKGHAARLDLDVSHLRPPTREQLPPGTRDMISSGNGRLRDAAPFVAAAWFQVRNYAVSVPMEPEAYDLVVEFPEGPKRVQVKSGSGSHPRSGWMVNVAHRPAFLDKTAGRVCYDPDDIDYFFVLDGDAELYLIPGAELAGRTKIAVSGYRQFRIGNAASLLEGCVDVRGGAEQEGQFG